MKGVSESIVILNGAVRMWNQGSTLRPYFRDRLANLPAADDQIVVDVWVETQQRDRDIPDNRAADIERALVRGGKRPAGRVSNGQPQIGFVQGLEILGENRLFLQLFCRGGGQIVASCEI